MAGTAVEELKVQGARLSARGQLTGALELYAQAIAREPDDLGALEEVARHAALLGQETRALQALAHLAQVSCRTDDGWRGLVVARELSLPPVGLASAAACVAEAVQGRGLAHDDRPAPLWGPLGREDLRILIETLRVRRWSGGEEIVGEGAGGTSMYAVAEGTVEVSRRKEDGEARVVSVLGPGDVFGEVALVSDAPRMASVRARELLRTGELARADVLRVGWRHPEIVSAVERFCRERALVYVTTPGGPWAELAPQLRRAAADAFRWRAVPAGTELIRQGTPNDVLYILVRGRCVPTLSHNHGDESVLPEMREGDVFGEISLLLQKPASATVRAVTPCALLVLEREQCLALLERERGVKQRLTQLAIERLQASALVLARGVHEGEHDGRV
jgi:CRP-like cAMP-binding protein